MLFVVKKIERVFIKEKAFITDNTAFNSTVLCELTVAIISSIFPPFDKINFMFLNN